MEFHGRRLAHRGLWPLTAPRRWWSRLIEVLLQVGVGGIGGSSGCDRVAWTGDDGGDETTGRARWIRITRPPT